MRRLTILILATLVLLTLAGCSHLFQWVAVRDGIEFEGDSVVRVEGVEIRVHQFGVEDGWGSPEFRLRVRNDGFDDAVFDPNLCRVDIDGELMAPGAYLSLPKLTLRPGDREKLWVRFNGGLDLVPHDDPTRKDLRVVPERLTLHLPPVVINGKAHDLPAMHFLNPDP